MMEVKQNTAVDLNELLVAPKAAEEEGVDELDDAMMTDLSDEAASQDLNCDVIRANEKSNNGLVVTNGGGEALSSSLMDIDASEATTMDDDAPVGTEFEDDLLEEEDDEHDIPNINVNKMSSEVAPSIAEDDILADKVETSNSTTSSTTDRDPGDDLDTLLSKINDIVEDCMDNEAAPELSAPKEIEKNDVVVEEEEKCDVVTSSVEESCEIPDESVMFVEEPTDEESNIENDDALLEETEEIKETAEPQAVIVNETIINEIAGDKFDTKENVETKEQIAAIETPEMEEKPEVEETFEEEEKVEEEEKTKEKEMIEEVEKLEEQEQFEEKEKIEEEEKFEMKEKSEMEKIPVMDTQPATEEKSETEEKHEIEEEKSETEEKLEIKENTVNEDEKSKTHEKSKTEHKIFTEHQYENSEKIIEEEQEQLVDSDKKLLELSENATKSPDNQIETEDIDSEEEEFENEEIITDEPIVLDTADIEKRSEEEIRRPTLEQQITIEGTIEPLQHKQVEDSAIDAVASLNKEVEPAKCDALDKNVNQIPSKADSTEEIKQIEETKEVSMESKTIDKENQDDCLEKPQEIPDVTKSVEEEKTEKETKENIQEESTDKEESSKKDDKEVHEDSDDEIVFYVDDKPPAEKEKPKETAVEEPKKISEITSKETSTKVAETHVEEDDDVVILDDDDDGIEETDKKTAEPEKIVAAEKPSESATNQTDANAKTTTDLTTKESGKESSSNHSTDLDVDNSDNARDDFVTEKVPPSTADATNSSTTSKTEFPKPQTETEETNSNCSSSSNLLLEAKANDNSADDRNQEDNDNDHDNDNDNEEDDDDGDVELIENESKEAENSSEKGEEFAPPAKRLRLSEDSQVSSIVDETSNKSQKTTESAAEAKSELQSETAASTTSLKRSHDVIELELDDKSNDSKISTSTETLTKKPRTEDKPKEDVSAKADLKDAKPSKEEDESLIEEKTDLKKMIPSYKPIPLYPPPKLETLKSETTFSLDFLKKFRKSFDKMSKQDLEEMVLQKVVEAIIHKSEFAEMRELIEKQEKLISTHRTKITELSKQFRDLEMVHNRVVKDIEQRNSQFIMPVKITRAVGLQVYIPNKKTILDSSSGSNNNSSTSAIPASPQRSISAASSQSHLTSPQRPLPATAASHSGETQSRPSNALSSAVNAAISNAVRRGCAQKITPTRPVPSGSGGSTSAPSSTSASPANTTVYRTTNTNQTQTSSQPRILNKNATQTNTGVTTSTNAVNVQRNRYIPPNSENMRMQQQQNATSRPISNAQRVIQPKPPPPVANTTVPRRSEPAASAASSNNTSSLDSYMNTLSQLTGGNTAVSITPAKPKEKAVIDLTDEDEIAPTPAPSPAATNTPTSSTPSTNNGPAINPAQRRSLPTQNNNTNSNTQFARNAPPLARIPPINQMSNTVKVGRPPGVQAQKSTNSSFSSTTSTPGGTTITRINVSANTQNPQRVKYSHPAPLPATPPQAFNPSWKLPPPRPTIRISNLDNGIVISWTMEESMDRHAECVSYQIYAYQETSGPPMADSWRHVGDVKAMLLPMAVTLTQFQEGQRYFFAVRAVDCHQRCGPFSLPKTWS